MAQELNFQPAAPIDFTPAESIDFTPASGKELKESDFETVKVGNGYMSVRKGQAAPDYSKQIENRPDSKMFGGYEGMFDAARNYLTNKVGMSDYIPQFAKPAVAAAADLLMVEPGRILTDIFSTPEGVLTPGLVKGIGLPKAGRAITPEVLPPEIPPVRRALPPASHPDINVLPQDSSNPFIAGTASQVQRRNLITPQEEARLLGYQIGETGPIGTPSTPVHAPVDLGEVREAERLRNVHYTGVEQAGGRRLEIGNRPVVDIPPVAGDTHLGFEPTSRADLEYPLNVVPESVRPRAAQTVIRSLAGDVPVESTPREPVEFVSGAKPVEKPTPPRTDLAGGTAALRPGETILPSAARQSVRDTKAATGLNVEAGVKAAESAPAEVKEAVKEFVTKAGRPSEVWQSIYSQLGQLGQAGKDLVQRFQRVEQKASEYNAAWTEPLLPFGRKLSKSEFQNFGQYVEGKLPIPNDRVRKAVEAWEKYQNDMGDTAIAKGLHLKRGEEVIPFQKVGKNYFPHVPDESLTKPSLVEKLVANGVTRRDANRIAANWKRTGELFIGPQYSRARDAFKYRTDFDVALRHGNSMARRIAMHENLGPKDLAGKGEEGIADIIEATTDPQLAEKLAERLAGQGERPDPDITKWLNRARKFSSITSLPNFGPKNVILGQAQNVYMTALAPRKTEVVKEIFNLLKKGYRDEARASGALNSLTTTLAEEFGRSETIRRSKIGSVLQWGIPQGEKLNRIVATAIGRATVREAFKDFKSGVNVEEARRTLETFLSRDPNTITEMTPELERFGAGRMAELTQGLNRPGNLPYGWSQPVNSYWEMAKQMGLIFKKTGFQITKSVKDSIMNQPTAAGKLKAIATWAAISQVAGEMVGDTSSFITGKDRPENTAARIADNWGYAFFAGLPWELAKSAAYGPSALLGAAAGPFAQKGSEAAYDLVQSGVNAAEGKEDPLKPGTNFMLKNLPIPGRERLKGIFTGQ